ncbi:MAG: sulfatase/phosphatase domain-containing protein, partial [Verrucomicrobiota bacterium]
VPFIAAWPGTIRAGTTCAEPVISVDLLPTLAAAAGAALPKQPVDGVDLGPLFAGGCGQPLDRSLYWHAPGYLGSGEDHAARDTWRSQPAGAIRAGRHKLIEHFEDGRLELYDLVADIGETRDLAAAEPDRVAALRGRLEAWRRSVGAEPLRPNPDFDRAAWNRCHGQVDVSRLAPLPTSEAMRPLLADWRRAMDDPSRAGVHSLVFLEARDASVSGEKLLYEKPAHKDTLGYWVNPADTASWTFAAPRAGRYRVTVLQGCGRGQGGSVVALECGDSRLEFTVEETGHFQRFVPREVGLLTLSAGRNTLRVQPVRKAQAAVMDLRRVMLERIDDAGGRRP